MAIEKLTTYCVYFIPSIGITKPGLVRDDTLVHPTFSGYSDAK